MEEREDALTRAFARAAGIGVHLVARWQRWDRKTKHFCGNLKEAPAPVLCSSGICVVGKEKLQKLPLRELLETNFSSRQIPHPGAHEATTRGWAGFRLPLPLGWVPSGRHRLQGPSWWPHQKFWALNPKARKDIYACCSVTQTSVGCTHLSCPTENSSALQSGL